MNMMTAICERSQIKLTVDDYELLCLSRAFNEPIRTELIEGEILLRNTADRNGEPEKFKLTVNDFELLLEAGALRKHRHAELIDGTILSMNAQHQPHAFAKSRLAFRIQVVLQKLNVGLEAVTEVSVAMPPLDEPEPDIVVTRSTIGVGPVLLESIALLVEISDSTARFDLTVKVPTYANHGVAELWIVDLQARMLRQFWNPIDGAYANRRDEVLGGTVLSETILGLTVETDDLVQA